MSYKAIGFDWGGVLNGKPGTVFTQEAADLLGVDIETYRQAYFSHNKKVNRGEVDWHELWRLVLTDLEKLEFHAALEKLAEDANTDRLNTDVLHIADKLRAMGYKVGLLSNNTHEKALRMREIGLDKHFDVFHISAETGYVKPEPQAFSHLTDELGVSIHELIFIDDAEKSLSTAKECGFTPILFRTSSQLIAELDRLGIELH